MSSRLLGSTLVAVAIPFAANAEPLTTDSVKEVFGSAQLVADPIEVDCTLSDGAKTTCIQITVIPEPTTYETGPFCPTSVNDGPENAGIWFYKGAVVDADGAFFQNLAMLYDDDSWQIVDPDTGNINYTATLEGCEAAARPAVAKEYQNHCVQCLIEYYSGTAVTYSFPAEPVAAEQTSDISRTGVGVAFNGVRIDGPAPLDAILSAYTIATFDDCGGHVNPAVGYHYHAVTDCIEEDNQEHDGAHSAVVGIALDGHFISAHLNVDGSQPKGLDACYGHTTDDLGYHYHAGAAGSNQNLGCLTAQVGCSSGEQGESCDATARPRRP